MGLFVPVETDKKTLIKSQKQQVIKSRRKKEKEKLLEKEDNVNHIQTPLKSNIKLVNFPIHLFSTPLQFSDVSRSRERVH